MLLLHAEILAPGEEIHRAPGKAPASPTEKEASAISPGDIEVVLIAGIPGAGKTTVARLLAAQLPRSAVISGDDLRWQVIGGHRNPGKPWDDETRHQYYLSFQNAAALAANYVRQGFKVIVDDVVHAGDLYDEWRHHFQRLPYRAVLLIPAVEVALKRNAERVKFVPEDIIRRLHEDFRRQEYADWLVLDTSQLSAEETVSAIREDLDW